MSLEQSPVEPVHDPRSPAYRGASRQTVDQGHNEGYGAGSLLALAFGALGVVYGDIGTSPLYTLKECFSGRHGVTATPQNVIGVLSLIFWALALVVTRKYLWYVLRAGNQDEGGAFALLALILNGGANREEPKGALRWLVLACLFGASSIAGEGIITPAISVLSAVEGIGVVTEALNAYVVPITVVILIGLFIIQPKGTGGIGKVFGPATFLWFASIAAFGLPWVMKHPELLAAVNPLHGINFFIHHGWHGFFVLGSVVLCITGGEALYADMGHFGRKPIRLAWAFVVWPALLINYFGQGAFLLEWGAAHPGVVPEASNGFHPFFMLVPRHWLVFEVIIATVATVVASQALISGIFSMGQQAQALGYMPRLTIRHTNAGAPGQIYVPELNWSLMMACIALVIGFRSSSALAAAYGFAVTTAMTITSVLFYAVARRRWEWSKLRAGLISGSFLLVDVPFWATNIPKFLAGAWIPLVMGAAVFAVMTTWWRGRQQLRAYFDQYQTPWSSLRDDLAQGLVMRTPACAVFMTANPDPEGIPLVLMHHVRRWRVLPKDVFILTVEVVNRPFHTGDRLRVIEMEHGFVRVIFTFGFMEDTRVVDALMSERFAELSRNWTYVLGREDVSPGRKTMPAWRVALFRVLLRVAPSVRQQYGLKAGNVTTQEECIEM